jgi:hypothetical protein
VPELAHFTPTELPGTLAIWVAGIGLGLALASRASRATIAPLALMSALAGMGMLGDASGWPEPIRLAIDAAFLAAGGALSFALWHGRGHLPAAAQPD